jgi:hypothetical protein
MIHIYTQMEEEDEQQTPWSRDILEKITVAAG